MKILIKTSILVFCIAAISFGAKAQTSSSTNSGSSNGILYSVGVESGVSTGSFKDRNHWNIGGSLQADIPVASQFYLIINAGYDDFIGKNNVLGTGYNAPNISLLPVIAGLKFFPVKNLYIQGDAGAAFALNKSTVGYEKTAAFIYNPQVGIQFPLDDKSYLDAGIRYESSTKFTSGDNNSKVDFFGIRVAYAFGVN